MAFQALASRSPPVPCTTAYESFALVSAARYDPQPSRQVSILDNVVRVTGTPISLNGVEDGLVRDNRSSLAPGRPEVLLKRSERVTVVERAKQ